MERPLFTLTYRPGLKDSSDAILIREALNKFCFPFDEREFEYSEEPVQLDSDFDVTTAKNVDEHLSHYSLSESGELLYYGKTADEIFEQAYGLSKDSVASLNLDSDYDGDDPYVGLYDLNGSDDK